MILCPVSSHLKKKHTHIANRQSYSVEIIAISQEQPLPRGEVKTLFHRYRNDTILKVVQDKSICCPKVLSVLDWQLWDSCEAVWLGNKADL